MLRKRLNTTFISLLAFILIEAFAIFLISRHSTIQKYRIMSTIRDIQSVIWEKTSRSREYFSLKECNDSLRVENMRLLKEIEKYQAYTSKFIADSIIREYKSNFRYIPADVVMNTTNKKRNFLVINKGANDSIKVGMGVITPSGVVGHIYNVGKDNSLVASFLNPNNASYTATIKKSGAFGTMRWNGRSTDEATLSDIPIHSTFAIGDTITTSGYSAMYPKGIDIGRISSYEISGGTSYNITISLFQDFSNLHHVYVVDNPNNIELKALINKGDSL